MRFLALAPLFATLLFAGTSGAIADDVVRYPVFPPSGGVMCCCPSQWTVPGHGNEGPVVCAVPQTVVNRWVRENNAAETDAYERRAALGGTCAPGYEAACEDRDHGARPASGHGH